MSNYIFAIDPGNKESGYVLVEEKTLKPIHFGKADNYELMEIISSRFYWSARIDPTYSFYCCIEMVASYGMAVGKDVFETCVWIGRFKEHLLKSIQTSKADVIFIYRKDEKMNLCNSMKANDSNITQALVDRFAPGEKNHGKGTKKSPGWFYGFKKDIWQAYAVAVTCNDLYFKK